MEKERYIALEMEIIKFEVEDDLVQTSYHYQPGWDD